MKKIALLIVILTLFAAGLTATNTTSSSKGFMIDQTGGWWRAQTLHHPHQVITLEYAKGNGTSITVTAGYRWTTETLLISTVTYPALIIDSAGAVTTDPVTITLPVGDSTGSFALPIGVPETADYLYVKIEYTGGTTATVDLNSAPVPIRVVR
jgi:hypothetical protein